MTDPRPPRFDVSLVQRLEAVFGKDVDPGISLPADPEASKGGDRPPSSGLVGRLKARVVASTRYRLDGEIGRGGMGAILEVWDEDLRRKLAMKVALGRGEGSSGADELDPRLVARFLEEAQVTGQLEHPGIVPVHELGLDENGQVYFTMRLVRGRDLERIFELAKTGAENWNVTRALGVLLKVCEAMAYAHSRGVIHRDLKPANVMVGHFGEVYVMDWGLVRVQGHEDRHDVRVTPDAPVSSAIDALDIDSTVSTEFDHVEIGRREDASGSNREELLYTMDGDVIGTPSYMSPEQARGDLSKLDARSDVYAVGALLYRLLAGIAPFADGEDRSAMSVLSALLKGPPTKLEDLADAPGELIAICEKAMSREPASRYVDMPSLADDLRAFLEHRVVGAYETGAVAEARKWVRRNRPLAASLAAGVLALAGGLAASLVLKAQSDENAVLAEDRRVEAVGSARLAEERRVEAETSATLAEARRVEASELAQLAEERRVEAHENANVARRQALIAVEVNDFLNNDMLAAIAPEEMGSDVTMRQVLDAASARLEFRVLLEPTAKAQLHMTIGTAYIRIGEYVAAHTHLVAAAELRTTIFGASSEQALEALAASAAALDEQGRYGDALAAHDEVIALAEESRGAEDRLTLTAKSDRASVLRNAGRTAEARAELEALRDVQRRVQGERSHALMSTLNSLALVYSDLGMLEESAELSFEVVELRREIDGPRHRETLTGMSNLAVLLVELGRFEESVALNLEVDELRKDLLGADHPDRLLGLGNLGTAFFETGRLLKAQRVLEESYEGLRDTLGPDHPYTLVSGNTLAVVYSRRRKYEQALELRLAVLEAQRRVVGPEHRDTMTSMGNLAVLYREMDRFEESEAVQREVLALEQRVLGPDHPKTLSTLENLGGLLFTLEDYAGALEITEQVYESRKRVLGDDHPDVAKTTNNLGMIAMYTGDTELARAYFEESIAISRAALGDEHPQVAETLRRLGDMASDADDFETARGYYRRAIEVYGDERHETPEVGYYLHQIGYGRYADGEYAPAVEFLTECVRIRRKVLGDDDVATLLSIFVLAKAHMKNGDYELAEPLALEFHERQVRTEGEYIDEGPKLLVRIYDGWGKPEQADEWR